jgi:hypothetical protein
MFSLHGKLSGNLIIFVLALFVFVSLLGIGMGMEVRDGQMSSCPLMASGASLCQMSVTEHISKWQQAFLGVPSKTNFLAFALLLAAAVPITFAKSLFQHKKLTELAARLFTYHKEHLVRIFDPLLIAFSDGILNPRIYEPAHI